MKAKARVDQAGRKEPGSLSTRGKSPVLVAGLPTQAAGWGCCLWPFPPDLRSAQKNASSHKAPHVAMALERGKTNSWGALHKSGPSCIERGFGLSSPNLIEVSSERATSSKRP